MDLVKVKAAPGRRVRDPKTAQLIPADGILVNPTEQYWFRRLRDGDVVKVTDTPPPAPVAANDAAADTGRKRT